MDADGAACEPSVGTVAGRLKIDRFGKVLFGPDEAVDAVAGVDAALALVCEDAICATAG